MELSLICMGIGVGALVLIKGNKKNSAKRIGKSGEAEVSKTLKELGRGYKVIDNVYIPTYKGTSQIDHVVVSKKGILCVETKNYKGKIGVKNKSTWTQYLGNKKYDFYSPVMQNDGHIKALSKYLGMDGIQGVVVFNKADISSIKDECVVGLDGLNRYIVKNKGCKLTDSQVNDIYKKLKKLKNGKLTELKHINHVKKAIKHKSKK